MIQITLSFSDITEAHAALGNLMARMTTAAPTTVEAEPGVGNAPAIQSAVDLANQSAVGLANDEKPKRKPRPKGPGKDKGGRPKGSKDGEDVVRKGTKAAAGNITLESLQTDLSTYANTHGFKQARSLLSEFNVKRLSELREDDYFKFGRNMAKAVESNV